MLLDFLREHRDQLIERSRRRVALRTAPRAGETELQKGIPLFLTQLTETFRLEMAGDRADSGALEADATVHGAELLKNGLSVAQAIHDYGDICQVVSELATELSAPIPSVEYTTFNRCLDDAMASAVTEYLRCREREISRLQIEQLGTLAHEQRNLLSAALLAFETLRRGSVGIGGSTGDVLSRSLLGLRKLTDHSLSEVRVASGLLHRTRVELASFVEEIEAAAAMEARARGLRLTVVSVPYGAAVDADNQLLGSAVMNLLGNAFKFTKAGGHIVLRARVGAGKAAIEVEDECGGLPGTADDLFRPFEQRGTDRTGLGLGLGIARKAVAACGGSIHVTNLLGKGCVFTVELPLAAAA